MELFLKPAQRRHLVPAPNFRSCQTSTYAGCSITCVRARVQSQNRSCRRACPTLWKRASRTHGLGPHSAESDFPNADFWTARWFKGCAPNESLLPQICRFRDLIDACAVRLAGVLILLSKFLSDAFACPDCQILIDDTSARVNLLYDLRIIEERL